MNKKNEFNVSLRDFRRRALQYLDRVYETKEPLFLYSRKQLVGVIWKAYGPNKVKNKLAYGQALLGAMAVELAGKGGKPKKDPIPATANSNARKNKRTRSSARRVQAPSQP